MTTEEEVQNPSTSQSVTSQTTGDDNNQYIQALNELKSKSVDRGEYDKLKAENKKLLDSIVNGREIELPAANDEPTVQELRNKMFNEEQTLTNLEFAKDALELRKQLMSEGKPDPFLPVGRQITPTDEDIATAQKVAEVLQECVDYADGDAGVFTTELQRRTIDVRIR